MKMAKVKANAEKLKTMKINGQSIKSALA